MQDIFDQMEEHIAAIRNLERNFEFHSGRLDKLMKTLSDSRLRDTREVKETAGRHGREQKP